MKILDEKEVKKESESLKWFDGDAPSSDFKLGFVVGSASTELELIPIMIEFAEWCGAFFVKANGCWFVNYTDQRDKANWRTTEQLLEQFIKSRK